MAFCGAAAGWGHGFSLVLEAADLEMSARNASKLPPALGALEAPKAEAEPKLAKSGR